MLLVVIEKVIACRLPGLIVDFELVRTRLSTLFSIFDSRFSTYNSRLILQLYTLRISTRYSPLEPPAPKTRAGRLNDSTLGKHRPSHWDGRRYRHDIDVHPQTIGRACSWRNSSDECVTLPYNKRK